MITSQFRAVLEIRGATGFSIISFGVFVAFRPIRCERMLDHWAFEFAIRFR